MTTNTTYFIYTAVYGVMRRCNQFLPSSSDAIIRLELHSHDVSRRLDDGRRRSVIPAKPAKLVAGVDESSVVGGDAVVTAGAVRLQVEGLESEGRVTCMTFTHDAKPFVTWPF